MSATVGTQPPSNSPEYQARQKKILSALKGQIEPVETSSNYRQGIFIVTVVMVLLPLIYLGIIALVGYGVYYHAVNHGEMIDAARGRGKGIAVLAYVAPMVMGAFLVLFMLKPIFARAASTSKKRVLKPLAEPLLFHFVHSICDAVRAPRPKSIEMDCDVNASASFRRGFWSVLSGNDLTLTIGTPLVAGLNTRQLAGVLAHEFGHFSQGAGMRLTYIIRTISFWLTRAVYERDEWDERLVSWSQSIDIRIGWILYVTRIFVWLTRKILWCLMWVGHAVSGYMLREMEFDADRHEARLAGSATFESTARRLAVLNFANQGAQRDLADFYREGRLGDDLAKLIRANAAQFDSNILAKINQFVDEQKTGTMDTHPCDTDRIANAKLENTNGIFQLERPSTELFRDFDTLSRNITIDYYSKIFGEKLRTSQLHKIDELLERQKGETNAYEAVDRFFQGCYIPSHSLQLSPPQEKVSNETLQQIKSLRKQIVASAEAGREALRHRDKIDDTLVEISQADKFLNAGFTIKHNTFSQPLTSAAEVNSARIRANGQMADIKKRLTVIYRDAVQRLQLSLLLLNHARVAERLQESAEWRVEARKLPAVFHQIVEQSKALNQLRLQLVFLNSLLLELQNGEPTEADINRVRAAMRETNDQIVAIRASFKMALYPFDHADKQITIARFILKEIPDVENPGEILEAAEEILSTLPRLQYRILGRLCWIAEQAEKVAGLQPLPAPQEDEDAK